MKMQETSLEKLLNFTVDEYFEERGFDGRDMGYFNPGTNELPSFKPVSLEKA